MLGTQHIITMLLGSEKRTSVPGTHEKLNFCERPLWEQPLTSVTWLNILTHSNLTHIISQMLHMINMEGHLDFKKIKWL